MQSRVHNLDDSVQEYFEFKLFGKAYRFRHLNTEENEQLQVEMKEVEEKGGDTKFQQFLYPFITPVNPEDPSFEEATKKMLTPHWRNFSKMIKEEFAA